MFLVHLLTDREIFDLIERNIERAESIEIELDDLISGLVDDVSGGNFDAFNAAFNTANLRRAVVDHLTDIVIIAWSELE